MSELKPRSFIILYFPFRHPSGVASLFFRIADWLVENSSALVAVIDYEDGQIASRLPYKCPIQLIPFKDGVDCLIPDDATLLMQTAIPYTFPRNLKLGKGTKLIQWHFLYSALVNTLIPINGVRKFQHQHPGLYQTWMSCFQPQLKKAIHNYIKTMINNNALIFHDRYIVEQTSKYLNIQIDNPICIPVPVKTSAWYFNRPFPETKLRCGWVGRLYDFKIHILIHTARRLSNWAKKSGNAIELCVVGDGDEAWRLEKLAVEHEYFQIYHAGIVPSAELETFMINRFDLAFSMGTSALESAAIGIPTVLLDYSFDLISKNYRYRWLFDSSPGDIGHRIGPKDFEEDYDSLEMILEQARTEYIEVSKKCFNYCKKYHSIDAIGQQLLKVFETCNYTWADVPERLIKMSIPRRVKSVVKSALKHY